MSDQSPSQPDTPPTLSRMTVILGVLSVITIGLGLYLANSDTTNLEEGDNILVFGLMVSAIFFVAPGITVVFLTRFVTELVRASKRRRSS